MLDANYSDTVPAAKRAQELEIENPEQLRARVAELRKQMHAAAKDHRLRARRRAA